MKSQSNRSTKNVQVPTQSKLTIEELELAVNLAAQHFTRERFDKILEIYMQEYAIDTIEQNILKAFS